MCRDALVQFCVGLTLLMLFFTSILELGGRGVLFALLKLKILSHRGFSLSRLGVSYDVIVNLNLR